VAAAFGAGVEAYEAGRPLEADARFREVVAAGAITPNVLFNLGNAAYRAGRPAEAVFAYEWALELAPADEDVRDNLDLARQRLVHDEVASGRSVAAERVVTFLRALPPAWTLVPALVAWTLGFVLLCVRLLRRAEGATPWALLLVLGATALGAAGAFGLAERHGPPRAVLQPAEVAVKSGPGPQYATLFEIHGGTVVRVVEERGDWRQVQIPGGPGGWVRAEALAVIGRPETLAPLPPASAPASPAPPGS
jgi:hypothetical protein